MVRDILSDISDMSSLDLMASIRIISETKYFNICCPLAVDGMERVNCCQANSFFNGVWNNYSYQLVHATTMELPLYIFLYVAILNCLVFVVGIIGNLLVIQAVLKLKVMRTRMNYFLMSLSVADLLVLTVCQPSAMLEFYAKDRWLFGEVMCKIVPFLENSSLHSSILTLLTIGFERYCAICDPFKKQRGSHFCRTRNNIAGIWMTSYLLTLPFVFMTSLEDAEFYDGSKVKVCRTKMTHVLPRVYIMFLFCVLFLLPLVLLTYMYSATIWQLSRMSSSPLTGDYQNKKTISSRRQVVRMMVYIMVLFFACLLPIRVVILLVVFVTPETMETVGLETYLNVLSCVRIMMYINSAGNPIIYGLLSTKFRDAYRKLVPNCNDQQSNRADAFMTARGTNKAGYGTQSAGSPCNIIAVGNTRGTDV